MKRFAVSAGLLCVVLILTALCWWMWIELPPRVSVPTPALPSPNAYDIWVHAGSLLVRDREVGEAIGTSEASTRTYTLAEKDALVQANDRALRRFREGLRLEYYEPPVRSFVQPLPHLAKYRGLSRLLKLEGQVRADRGDWRGCAASNLDGMQMGAAVPRGGVLIGMLVGIAIQSINRGDLWRAVDHLDARSARAAARRLERMDEATVPLAETLREESWAGQAGLAEMMRSPRWRQQILSDLSGASGGTSVSSLSRTLDFLRLAGTSKRGILSGYTRYMEQLIATAKQPYAARAAAPPVPKDAVNALLAPWMSQATFRHVLNASLNRLLITALALRAYRLERGAYPNRLEQLAPRYLKRVPQDPFARKGVLRYRRRGSHYLLYSLGPDCADNGGLPIRNPRAGTSRRRVMVEVGSSGDIVAGVNNL